MQKVKLSIIIVKYKSEKELKECIASIKTAIPHEIIVIDNDKNNVGYGAGINKGFKRAKGEYLLIANPDTIWTRGSIDKLISFYKSHSKSGVTAPDQTDDKGMLYEFVGTGKLTPISAIFGLSIINRIFPSNPISKKYWIRRNPRSKFKEVEVAPGGAFLVSKKIFEEAGGFDENFFLYFEESDFCRRIKQLGYRNYILQSTKITHLWGVSTKSNPKKNVYFKKSRKYYFEKYYGKAVSNLVEFVLNLNKWKITIILLFILTVLIEVLRRKI
ncbi:MAG TPA: glycosyltransferase family 2 protein [Patescibacteria group bacterium]